jgi:sialic acid synthase SpsE
MVRIIAELCQNHNGQRSILEEMIHAAKDAGADFVKIQSMLATEITKRTRFDDGLVEGRKIKVIKRPYKAEFERLKKLDLNDEDHYYFLELCKKYNVKPMTTIFTRQRLNFIKKLNLKVIKVSSFDCASHALIQDLAKENFDELIISTGATFDREIIRTADILKLNQKKFTFLHCISIYPTPLENSNLNRLNFLKNYTKNIGISDHTVYEKDGAKLSAAAVFLGANTVEKHFTILKKNETKDGIVSANFNELKQLVKLCKLNKDELAEYIKKEVPEFKTMLGNQSRELSDEELLNRDYYQGRFASKNSNGEIIYNWDEKDIF